MSGPAPQSEPFTVAALYRFADFPDPGAIRMPLLALCEAEDVRGTLLLAREGINGTIAGPADGIAQVIAHIRSLPDCQDLDVKYAQTDRMPFGRMKVRVKREIVTMGHAGLDPARHAGTYVDPADWNALIADPDTILIDTRNAYEVAIGSFAGAIDPGTASFSAFPAWFDAFAADLAAQGRRPKVAMFCTGGIRCEKSTAYARARGIDEVYHLRGGILRYLEEVPEAESLWQGDCFVFDERVAVGHGLRPGDHVLCRDCGAAVRPGGPHACTSQG
ncbi:rhodanese-related sulfurtransferase [Sphingobium algorifonticola]|uniref:tRNA uridine(34) hydroxylase n=1 Tax=Sphingobium algorifonticola TaxID=2008318 RepID=A0A437JCX2_9SPHN|nr:rhodanese-related sulfurtransferase [Sphingobium algorifonticola]RVT43747.1 rhodanese-related sulfurtransferase [Sphingobium algorifonticola]